MYVGLPFVSDEFLICSEIKINTIREIALSRLFLLRSWVAISCRISEKLLLIKRSIGF